MAKCVFCKTKDRVTKLTSPWQCNITKATGSVEQLLQLHFNFEGSSAYKSGDESKHTQEMKKYNYQSNILPFARTGIYGNTHFLSSFKNNRLASLCWGLESTDPNILPYRGDPTKTADSRTQVGM